MNKPSALRANRKVRLRRLRDARWHAAMTQPEFLEALRRPDGSVLVPAEDMTAFQTANRRIAEVAGIRESMATTRTRR
jgi:hypothetical protein